MFERRKPHRDLKETFLIVCEGKNTEKIYFESFKLTTITIKVIEISNKGGNALLFVQSAKKYIDSLTKKFDNYYLVFDKDQNTDENFNNAIITARKYKLQVVYSNQAFEVWYLLHYQYFIHKLDRKNYKTELTKHLGFTYEKDEKTCKKIFLHLYPKTSIAIENAKKGFSNIGDHTNPATEESSTNVFYLVEKIISKL